MANGNETPARRPVGWRSAPGTTATAVPGPGRAWRLVFLFLLLLGILGAAAAWAMMRRNELPVEFWSLAIREYKEPLQHTPFALQDRQALSEGFPHASVAPYSVQNRNVFETALQDLSKRAGGVLVVHLCALAYGDGGTVYVIPGNASAPENGIPLAQVLQALREAPAKQKLLILDVARPVADRRSGVLVDNVAEQVYQQLGREQAKPEGMPFFVLTACERNAQVALVSEDLQQSIFVHYLKQGLGGAADGWTDQGGGGDRDNWITVKELSFFVRNAVDTWAQQQRGTRQTPKLFGNAEDFRLIACSAEPEPEPEEPPARPPYPAWLEQAWKRRDAWWVARAYRVDLPGYLQMESTLLRYDQQWRNGKNGKDDKDGKEEAELKSDLEAKMTQWAKVPALPTPRLPKSLFAATADKDKDTDQIKSIRGRLIKLLDKLDGSALSKEAQKEFDEQAMAMHKELTALVKADYPLAAWILCDAAGLPQVNLERPALKYLRQTHEEIAGGQRTDYVEVALLIQLDDLSKRTDDDYKKWPKEAARQAIWTQQKAIATWAMLVAEPLAYPWVVEVFTEAEKQRKDGHDKLLRGADTMDREVGGELLASASKQYEVAAQRIDTIGQVLRARDRAGALLPAWGAVLVGAGTPEVIPSWSEHVRSVRTLVDLLNTPAAADVPLGAAAPALATLDVSGPELEDWLKRKLERCLKDDSATSARDLRELQALLNTTVLTAGERKTAWDRSRAIAGKLRDEKAKARPLDGDDTLLPDEFARAERRARIGVDLLWVLGINAAKLDNEFAAVQGRADPAAWRDFGKELADGWRQPLPAPARARLQKAREDMEQLELKYRPR
jgi:hypothetical protein